MKNEGQIVLQFLPLLMNPNGQSGQMAMQIEERPLSQMDEEEKRLLVEQLKMKELRKCKNLFDELLAMSQCHAITSTHQAKILMPAELIRFDGINGLPYSQISSTSSNHHPIQHDHHHQWAAPQTLREKKAENQNAGKQQKTLPSIVPFHLAKSPFGFSFSTAPPNDSMPISTSNDPQRPHKCEHCGKAFRFKSNLFEHKSLHYPPAGMANGIGGEGGGNGKSANGSNSRQPFVCPFCAKTCRLKGNLKKHLQVHVNSPDDLERLWKRSFSRQSGRPRKNAPHRPLPKPGDDLGLVPLPPLSSASSSSSADHRHFSFSSSCSSSSSSSSSCHHSPSSFNVQWTFADQICAGSNGSNIPAEKDGLPSSSPKINPSMMELFISDLLLQKAGGFGSMDANANQIIGLTLPM